MKSERLLYALTAANFLLLLVLVAAPMRPAEARPESSVLRGSALEIVDDRGRVRASIKLHPAAADYPETVVLRLIDPNGRPEVKIEASVQGGGIAVIGEADATHAQLGAKGAETRLRLATTGGREMVLKP